MNKELVVYASYTSQRRWLPWHDLSIFSLALAYLKRVHITAIQAGLTALPALA